MHPNFPSFDVDFDACDIELNFDETGDADKFLGHYTLAELRSTLKDSEIEADLARLGFVNLDLKIDCRDHFVHRLVLTDKSLFRKNSAKFKIWKPEILSDNEFLVDLFARRKEVGPYDLIGYQEAIKDSQEDISSNAMPEKLRRMEG